MACASDEVDERRRESAEAEENERSTSQHGKGRRVLLSKSGR